MRRFENVLKRLAAGNTLHKREILTLSVRKGSLHPQGLRIRQEGWLCIPCILNSMIGRSFAGPQQRLAKQCMPCVSVCALSLAMQ